MITTKTIIVQPAIVCTPEIDIILRWMFWRQLCEATRLSSNELWEKISKGGSETVFCVVGNQTIHTTQIPDGNFLINSLDGHLVLGN
jgi:hypothetical protein